MDRGSDKHGSRLDDQMSHEAHPLEQGAPTESRAQESRQAEPASDGEPEVDARLGRDDIEARSELARFIEPSVFPAARDDLIDSARGQDAPGMLVEQLSQLPDDRVYENVQAVWEDIQLR